MLDTNIERLVDEYGDYAKPKLTRLLKTLKIDKVYTRADGDRLFYQDPDQDGAERSVIDLLGGFGSTLLGHHHPEIVAELKQVLEEKCPVHAQASVRVYSGQLGKKINELVRGEQPSAPRYYTHLCNTGTEAVEAALKHALFEFKNRRESYVFTLRALHGKIRARNSAAPELPVIARYIEQVQASEPLVIALRGAYHGKTAASVQVTGNSSFREMYTQTPLAVEFVDAWDPQTFDGILDRYEIQGPSRELGKWNRVAAVIYEPIQGEGGVEPLPARFVEWLKNSVGEKRIPRISDEIQTGTFRTGAFLAGSKFGFSPEYFLLGKSLGGGFAKISAFCVAEQNYQEDFSIIHSSTFAEDEVSSRLAIRTLNVLEKSDVSSKALQFSQRVSRGIAQIQQECPGLIREVRGEGFLLGIEFDFTGKHAPTANLLRMVYDAGYASYLVMSALLNRFDIRVAVTLSRPEVIRVEPSALISAADTERFIESLTQVCRWLRDRKMLRLTSHMWKTPLSEADLEFQSPVCPQIDEKEAEGMPAVAFASHVIDLEHLVLIDPMFGFIPPEERRRFLRKYMESEQPLVYHEQIVYAPEGADGKKVGIKFHMIGTMRTTDAFEESLRSGDFKAIRFVRDMVKFSREMDTQLVGLGQYTSIVSDNGYGVEDLGVPSTTGNSLTAGLAYLALKKALAQKGVSLGDIRVGVVGAAGNICNVVAQLLGDEANALTLITRDDPDSLVRMRAAAGQIFANSSMRSENVTFSSNLEDLRECGAVLIGTNTARQIITPEILAPGATVVDLSVPSNVDPRVFVERPDVRCIQGGLAQLSEATRLTSGTIPLPKGQLYACMAETITLGLNRRLEHFSHGPLSKAKVQEIIQLAERVGITLGSLIPLSAAGTRK